MKRYQIIEENEKRGTLKHGIFNNLKDAITELNWHKSCAKRYGYIKKEVVKSFTWEWLDEYYTPFRSTYKVVKIS